MEVGQWLGPFALLPNATTAVYVPPPECGQLALHVTDAVLTPTLVGKHIMFIGDASTRQQAVMLMYKLREASSGIVLPLPPVPESPATSSSWPAFFSQLERDLDSAAFRCDCFVDSSTSDGYENMYYYDGAMDTRVTYHRLYNSFPGAHDPPAWVPKDSRVAGTSTAALNHLSSLARSLACLYFVLLAP